MNLLNPTSLLGVVLLFYLASFIAFAILRIATGISIQRIGYFSLRRIAYTPRDGIRIDIRGLGLALHRPTFAQPTWISLRFTELKVTVDVQALTTGKKRKGARNVRSAENTPARENGTLLGSSTESDSWDGPDYSRSRTWKRLTQLKEKLKKLHEKIHWIRMVDVFALNTSVVIANVGKLEVGLFTMAVDTRRKTVDRGRLFQHKRVPETGRRPAEWRIAVRGVLFTPLNKESLEVIDTAGLNIHGLLYPDRAGLRDASVSFKLGRVHIPYDDFLNCYQKIEHTRSIYSRGTHLKANSEVSVADVIEELDRPGSREANIVRTVSDSKEFISSILRGIEEIQIAVNFIGLSKDIHSLRRSGSPLYMNFSMNELGIDMHRLNPKSPAHRMYFSTKDIAHQALVAAISIGLSLDDGTGNPERVLYVPMATTTIKTTLPSRTVTNAEDENAAERNANILFATLVVTSPSVDGDPRHMPLLLALLRSRRESTTRTQPAVHHRHHLIRRLLPKASIKFSIQEPVLRIALPPADPKLKGSDEYDLLISSISSISLDLESSHSSAGELHYALNSSLRMNNHRLYYHTAAAERHNLVKADAVELHVRLSASPEVCVIATGDLRTFSIHLVRPEIAAGLRLVVQELYRQTDTGSETTPKRQNDGLNILRSLPPWLAHFQLQGSDFGVEIAGLDSDVSRDIRGVAFQLESWTAEYKAKKAHEPSRPPSRRRKMSHSEGTEEPALKFDPSTASQYTTSTTTDGRRLAIHVRRFVGFVVEGIDVIEPEPFASLPRFEVALSTSSDDRGQFFHLNSHAKSLQVQYSLYRYYAIGIAFTVLRDAFAGLVAYRQRLQNERSLSKDEGVPMAKATQEMTTIDLKVELLQIKAKLPSEPPMLLQIHAIEAGRHRWAVPFLKSRYARLCVEAPHVPSTWARMVSIKNSRIEFREIRRKQGRAVVNEKSIDLSSEFVRFAVPHQLVLHKVFDNFANVIKATEQLHHQFKTGSSSCILKKRPEEPKSIPRISLRSKALLLDLEDGPFEWKLGCIYRAGLLEQKQRAAREEAYKAKVKNLESSRQRRQPSRHRSPSADQLRRGRSYRSGKNQPGGRSSSEDTPRRGRAHSPFKGAKNMRYNPDGECELSKTARVTATEAWQQLQRHNAQSWKKRIDTTYRMQNKGIRAIRGMFWGDDEHPSLDDENEPLLSLNGRPGLMTALISDVHVILDKPSFPIKEYPHFLHRVGKGMPYDMQYTLIIPLNVHIDMGEARVTLRDYPLPLVHVPAIRPGQSARLPSCSVRTDFIIAEEYRGDISTKQVQVEVIPPEKMTNSTASGNGYAVDVYRTVSPVKTYSDVQITINTSAPTSITWGTSYQPAIQDMMMVIEGFTKPQLDPSDRVGFWDKLRLSQHSRINVAWKGDGDVHLKLKGSRDPYVVTGLGAGFIMCWRNNVQWGIHQDDDPKKFMSVTSGEYVLAIPDYSHQARETQAATGGDSDSISSRSSTKGSAIFKKVIMKLSGNVRWLAGLVLERNIDNGGRSFDFIPHYDVILTTPERAVSPPGQEYDAFRGFRSNHIHLSVAVTAPLDRDWNVNNLKPSTSYNTVHLTPRFFTHFFSWWSLFSGIMSLPIRQGKLFPGIEKSSKKFGRHLATFKYSLLLSPLFITHMYIHKDAEDYTEDMVSATGLKLRIDSFMLDLHQRREEFAAQGRGRAKQMKTSGMRINQAQLDFITADLRAISASIAGTSSAEVERASDADLASYQQPGFTADMSRFTIPDNDFSWVDMDDFVELDWILPAETNPETKIMPLGFAPRFTYFRQTDHQGSISGDVNRSSSFGNEPTHYCVMSQDNDPRKVQCRLIQERIDKIEEQLKVHDRTLGEQELRVVRDANRDGSLKERFEMLRHQGDIMESKRKFLQKMLLQISNRLEQNRPWTSSDGDTWDQDTISEHSKDLNSDAIETAPLASFINDFNNRFIVHNAQLKWNNSLRNIILRYVHQVSQRRGFIYYMTRRAVKFILDIVDEQNKNKVGHADYSNVETPVSEDVPEVAPQESKNEPSVEERIQGLLNDGKRFVDADDPSRSGGTQKPDNTSIGKDISKDFTPLNSYHVRLIAPQIQLQSDKNAKSVLLVTAKGMQLKVLQVMDKDRMADDVSGLVQRRFSIDMDSVQFFVATQKSLMAVLNLHSGNRYGAPKGSAWPPWVPFEVNFDFDLHPFGFSRVVQKTSASLRYDKYNTLRLKYNDEVSSRGSANGHSPESAEGRIDHLWVNFPQIRAICDSTQYYTMYVIVLDLLLYSEPLEKVRSEKLEKIMLASDFSDLRGTPEMVINLQDRIRQLEEIKTYFQVHAKFLDRQGWQDRLAIEQDLAKCEDELFFVMKAITTSQRKNEDRAQTSQTTGLLRWYMTASEIVWHLMRDKNEPLMEIQLQKAVYDRTDNSDGSNFNSMLIERIHGLNLLPDALYPEMIAPYTEIGKSLEKGQQLRMLQVHWHMLEAIAGIPVLDQFEVNLFPLKVQLEREIGKKLFEYIFPGINSGNGQNGSFSPFLVKNMQPTQDEDGDSDPETEHNVSEYPGLEANSNDDQRLRPGSLEMRLRPTHGFAIGSQHNLAWGKKQDHVVHSKGNTHHFRPFHSNRSHSASRTSGIRSSSRQVSRESLPALARQANDASSSNLSQMNGNTEKSKRFALHRSMSHNQETEDKASDDLGQMMARASNYMTLAYVKIPSVVLCLSYKGRGERNIEDVHNFVFRMPVLEYRNKTWSNLDLALRLKKDVIRALISHTGAIIGNKFSKQRPSKHQQSRLRDFANASSLLPNTTNLLNMQSKERSGSERDSSLLHSVASRSSTLVRSSSYGSNLRSSMASSSGAYGSESPSITESQEDGDDRGELNQRPSVLQRNTFTRRFTSESPGKQNASSEEGDDNSRKKSVLLLGKKFLGSMS